MVPPCNCGRISLLCIFRSLNSSGMLRLMGTSMGLKSVSRACAECQRPVGQTARGAVVELVSAYAVGGIIVGEASGCPVIFAQSVLGAYPEVALQVFLDARYVEAGGAGHGCHPSRFGMVAHQRCLRYLSRECRTCLCTRPWGRIRSGVCRLSGPLPRCPLCPSPGFRCRYA